MLHISMIANLHKTSSKTLTIFHFNLYLTLIFSGIRNAIFLHFKSTQCVLFSRNPILCISKDGRTKRCMTIFVVEDDYKNNKQDCIAFTDI